MIQLIIVKFIEHQEILLSEDMQLQYVFHSCLGVFELLYNYLLL